MKRILFLAVVAFALPAFAQTNNVGTCGWGSKLFEGDKGIAPQVLAVTTNGTFGNQTFAISSGTSGCTQNGVVSSNWKSVMFIDGNKTRLAQDVSAGEGEALGSLANVVGVNENDKVRFFQVAKANFERLFPSARVTAGEVATSLKGILESDSVLNKYASQV